MKAIPKFIQLSLTLVFLLTTLGFRVNISDCHGHAEKQISFFGGTGCCCAPESNTPPAPDVNCGNTACVVQLINPYPVTFQSKTQLSIRAVKVRVNYPSFARVIQPSMPEKLPHFNLPPPRSGKIIGIFHHTFIV